MLIMETLERTLKLGTIQQDQQLCNDVVSATIQPVINGSLKSKLSLVVLSLKFGPQVIHILSKTRPFKQLYATSSGFLRRPLLKMSTTAC